MHLKNVSLCIYFVNICYSKNQGFTHGWTNIVLLLIESRKTPGTVGHISISILYYCPKNASSGDSHSTVCHKARKKIIQGMTKHTSLNLQKNPIFFAKSFISLLLLFKRLYRCLSTQKKRLGVTVLMR